MTRFVRLPLYDSPGKNCTINPDQVIRIVPIFNKCIEKDDGARLRFSDGRYVDVALSMDDAVKCLCSQGE